MNDPEYRGDQAENLRTKMIDEYKEVHGDYPPRGEVHKDKKKKTKLKMKYPIISLLAFIFILLPILIITIYYSNDSDNTVTINQPSGNEMVYISNNQNEEETIDEDMIEEETESINQDEIETNQTESDADNKEATDQNNQPNETNVQSSNSVNKNAVPTDESEYREVKTHTVAAGETLFKIAIKYYNSKQGEEIIREFNGIEANDIYEGQVLKIPLK
ncbi:LysM peptidoglycan-binding domain-containing protein [Metabacillus sediminilitoris]|uniref:LysM peptidoglycan-binding domain-containing protein n=1 Tax=Metabacillus sediminilitoris TaxID=2567941 RepID=A0A4S4C6I0_9BACI|nr:LysM peptidoglycan-binding domain-containing protein [Metabacillus sediminilitoris]QGQ46725.1 LysM peptidoglycan-binding domain-containing protein [Metabacillus sediminilitoris]THF82875.1 LysM peptidoglycan-binding domain-containing protein [Metabacillus sediminilitoris]